MARPELLQLRLRSCRISNHVGGHVRNGRSGVEPRDQLRDGIHTVVRVPGVNSRAEQHSGRVHAGPRRGGGREHAVRQRDRRGFGFYVSSRLRRDLRSVRVLHAVPRGLRAAVRAERRVLRGGVAVHAADEALRRGRRGGGDHREKSGDGDVIVRVVQER